MVISIEYLILHRITTFAKSSIYLHLVVHTLLLAMASSTDLKGKSVINEEEEILCPVPLAMYNPCEVNDYDSIQSFIKKPIIYRFVSV